MSLTSQVLLILLLSYIRVNAFFYGQRHIASGLYVVTRQVDDINQSGYRTTLTLQRVAGDNDYFISTTKTVKSKVVDSISYSVEGSGKGGGGSANRGAGAGRRGKNIKLPDKKGLQKSNKPMSKAEFKNSKNPSLRSLYGKTDKEYERYLENVEKWGTTGAIGARARQGTLYKTAMSKHKR